MSLSNSLSGGSRLSSASVRTDAIQYTRGNAVALLGTSIFAGNAATAINSSGIITAHSFENGLGSEVFWRLGKKGYMAANLAFAGSFISSAQDAGVNTLPFLEKQVPYALANKATVALCGSGTNECGSSALSAGTITTYMNQYEAGLRQLIAGGCRPILTTIPPKTDSANAKINAKAMNAAIVKLAMRLNIPLIDLFLMCYDSSADDIISGYNTSDHVHIDTAAGQAAVGPVLSAAFNTHLGPDCLHIPAGVSLLTRGDIGSMDGTNPPTGYTTSIGGSGTFTHVALAPAAGEDSAGQEYAGVGWRMAGVATGQKYLGYNGTADGSIVPGQRYLFYCNTIVTANDCTSSTTPGPLIRLAITDGSSTNLGRQEMYHLYKGQTWTTNRFMAFAFTAAAGADRCSFYRGTNPKSGSSNTSTCDMTIADWGLIAIA